MADHCWPLPTTSGHCRPVLAIADHWCLFACLIQNFKVISNSRLKYYYFESVYMFRKVMILLFFTAPTMYVRMA
jgi:hypothetical protein